MMADAKAQLLMPTLMPTRATPGGTRRIHHFAQDARNGLFRAFADVAVLGGACNSKLVMSRSVVRVRSSALFLLAKPEKTKTSGGEKRDLSAVHQQ
jgi:hypothetical protein